MMASRIKFEQVAQRLAFAVSLLLFLPGTAFAITQAEWEADPSLIPAPSASSAFYVVAPTALVGEQTVAADAVGIDATPVERVWSFGFATPLNTHKLGVLIICL